MNVSAFENQHQGKGYSEGGYYIQCVKGGKVFIEDPNGWDMPATVFRPYAGNGEYGNDGALDGFYSFRDGFQSVVLNREGVDRSGRRYRIDIINDQNQLQRGDLVFTTGRDQYGHVGVFVGRDGNIPNTFQLFDQNGDNSKSPVFWWSNYNINTFVGAMRKVFLDQPQPPTPQPPVESPEFYTVKQGGWRSQVIQEIINDGIWQGTWQQNQPKFDQMNPITPQGGWRPGDQVRIKPSPVIDNIVTPAPIQPQPEAISTPAPTTMPTVSIDRPVIFTEEIQPKLPEPKPENVTKPEVVETRPQPETFDLNKFILGIVKGKNFFANSAFLAGIAGLFAFYNQNQAEINAGLTAVLQGLAILYTYWRKYQDKK